MSKAQKLAIFVFLLVGLAVRLVNLDSSVADWHSHRQSDTISVAKIFLQDGIDILHPRYYDISSTQSGLENPHGWRMVELPLHQTISTVFTIITHLPIITTSRLVSIIASLFSAYLVFLIAFKTTKQFPPSFLSFLVFLFLPFNIYYSRTILPEPLAVTTMLLALYSFTTHPLLSGIFLALGLLLKPFVGFIIAPTLLLYVFHQKLYRSHLVQLCLFSILSLAPFLIWRHWISQYPEGIPVSAWLLNASPKAVFPDWFMGINIQFLNHLVAFRPHWFHWLFVERLSHLILGIFGIIPFFLGLAYRRLHSQAFLLAQLTGVLTYFIVVAQGNIQHDYYQTLTIPTIAFSTGFGLYYLYRFLFHSRAHSLIALLIITVSSLVVSASAVIPFYRINRPEIDKISQKINELTPSNSLLIAPYQGDTTLLSATSRFGWPNEVYDIEHLKKVFYPLPLYLVSLNFDKYTNDIIPQYKTLYRDQQFIVLDLN